MSLRISAVVAGSLGTLANLLLIAFYLGLAVESEATMDLGYANDVAMIPYALALIPVVIGVFARVGPRRSGDLAVVILGLSSAVVLTVAQLLLVLGTVTFEAQIGFAATASFLLMVWVVLAQIRAQDRLSRRTRRWGVVIGLSVPTALLLLGIGVWNTYVLWAGLAAGGLAWLSLPGWLLAFKEGRPR